MVSACMHLANRDVWLLYSSGNDFFPNEAELISRHLRNKNIDYEIIISENLEIQDGKLYYNGKFKPFPKIVVGRYGCSKFRSFFEESGEQLDLVNPRVCVS